jgi:hypothetical protein
MRPWDWLLLGLRAHRDFWECAFSRSLLSLSEGRVITLSPDDGDSLLLILMLSFLEW